MELDDKNYERVALLQTEVQRVMNEKNKKGPETLIDEMVRVVFHTEPWVEHCYQWPPDETGRYNEWVEFKGGD
jgi:hypothetical protein